MSCGFAATTRTALKGSSRPEAVIQRAKEGLRRYGPAAFPAVRVSVRVLPESAGFSNEDQTGRQVNGRQVMTNITFDDEMGRLQRALAQCEDMVVRRRRVMDAFLAHAPYPDLPAILSPALRRRDSNPSASVQFRSSTCRIPRTASARWSPR